MSISLPFQLKAIACVKSIACVIKLMLVCDDKAARMRREALGYSRQKQLMDGADDVISFKSGRRHGSRWSTRVVRR
jgi:hypothetical protein